MRHIYQHSKCKFPILNYREKGENVASVYSYQTKDDIKKLFNRKIKANVRNLSKSFGQGSALIMGVAKLISNKKWK